MLKITRDKHSCTVNTRFCKMDNALRNISFHRMTVILKSKRLTTFANIKHTFWLTSQFAHSQQ